MQRTAYPEFLAQCEFTSEIAPEIMRAINSEVSGATGHLSQSSRYSNQHICISLLYLSSILDIVRIFLGQCICMVDTVSASRTF